MNRFATLALLALTALAPAALAETPTEPGAPKTVAKVGEPAPDFKLSDLNGKEVSLKDYAGKTVVLEWFNPGCPFVKYAHGDGPLKDQGNRATSEGVVWLAINSGAQGKEGSGLDNNKAAASQWGITYPVLLDESGLVGHSYGATSTPHMFVIDSKGVLAYAGALDNAPMGKAEGGKPQNYVSAALADLKAGRAVATPSTKSYGCSVKYGS